jgi:eukaryotic-like serine/threonine-protein kinase
MPPPRRLSDEPGTLTAPGFDPLLGATLDGRFKVVEPIGAGGMGRVYRAMQLPMNRPVALKVLNSNFGLGRDEAFRQRFLVEAELTSKLRHPNSVTVIDSGCTKEGFFYIAMEYLEGDTLEDVLLQEGALPWRRALNIAQQVARALREAHALGVVHRDLKPANVFLLNHGDDQDQVKVLDFGLVKSFVAGAEIEGRAITQQGMLMGSPPYMSPEQGDRNEADPRSDIYSLGIVLYEMLTGAPPFTGRAPLEVIMKHVNDPVPPLKIPSHLEVVPPELEALVRKCLAKSPMDRLQSLDEVLGAMQELTSPSFATPGFGTPGKPALPLAATRTMRVRNAEVMRPIRQPSFYKPALLFLLAVGVGSGVTWLLRPGAGLSRGGGEGASDVKPVSFRIDSVPEGAEVTVAGETLGTTPLEFELPAEADGRTSADITLSLEGYTSVTVTAGGSGPAIEVIQTLQPLPEAKVIRVKVPVNTARKKVQLSPAQRKKITGARSKTTSSARLSDGKDDDDPRAPDEALKRPSK